MGAMARGQQDVFSERLRRIQQGAPNTAGTIYVGPTMRRRAGGRLPLRAVLFDLAQVPMALALGAVAMLAGRIGAFHLLATPDLVPAEFAHVTALGADIAIGAVLLALLGWSFAMTGGLRRVALIAGFCGMMVAEPALFAQAPGFFAALTSEDFVQVSMARDTYLSDVLAAL